MLKKQSIHQLISKIVCVSLLLGTLPLGMPLHGQENKTKELEKLRLEINKEVTSIKKTVNRLQFARIAVPTILVGAGLTFTVIVATVVAILFMIHQLKLPKIKKLIEKHGNLQNLIGAAGELTLSIREESVPDINRLVAILKEGLTEFGLSLETKVEVTLKWAAEARALFYKEWQKVGKRLDQSRSLLIPFATFAGMIGVTIVGLVGTGFSSLGVLFGLSAVSVAAAFKGAKKLEQLEAEHPGILTPEQKKLLEKLKKLSKNPLTQAIIKNLRLKDALTKVTNTVVQQNTALVRALGKEKKARKIFGDYIKLKWQEELLTKGLAEGAGFIKSAIVKLQLKKAKKQLANIEFKHPILKTVLAGAAQIYIKEANGILQELKGQIVNAAEAGELKPEDLPAVPMPPIISL